jgi:hypothetical protein
VRIAIKWLRFKLGQYAYFDTQIQIVIKRTESYLHHHKLTKFTVRQFSILPQVRNHILRSFMEKQTLLI